MFKRTGDMVEIGGTVRIEPGPRKVVAKATEELLGNDMTADHYFAGERVVGQDADGNDLTHLGIDALAVPIVVGKDMTYLDWVAFQKDADAGHDKVFYLYQLSKPTKAEKEARESDAPFFREIAVFENEEEAISKGLELKPDAEVGMAYLNDNTLDNGLAALKAAATHVYICTADSATYTAATSTNALGNKNFGAGAVFPAAIAAGAPSGRKITTAAITDGTVTATGTAAFYSIVTAGSSRLEVSQSLSASQGVTSGNTFTLTAADIRLPNLGG